MSGSDEGRGAPAKEHKVLKLENWTCYSCGLELAERLRKVKGVKDVSLNFFTKQVLIDHEGARIEDIEKEIDKLGLRHTGRR